MHVKNWAFFCKIIFLVYNNKVLFFWKFEMEDFEQKNNEIEIMDASGVTFSSTEKLLDEMDTTDSVEWKKSPQELFNMFIICLRDSPKKISSIRGKEQEQILNFIMDTANKNIILTEYVSYIKRFDINAEGLKLDKKDKEIFTAIKDKIEETYNWDDCNGIDNRQLEQKIFTSDFSYNSLLNIWKELNSEWKWENIPINDTIKTYCKSKWLDLDNFQLFVDKFNYYNDRRLSEIKNELSNEKLWTLCWSTFDNIKEGQRMKYVIMDNYFNGALWYPVSTQEEFLNQFWNAILESLDTWNILVDDAEFYSIIWNNKDIVQLWMNDFSDVVWENTKDNLVVNDFYWIEMSSDVDPSVILSIVRRTEDKEKKMKVTNLIKEKWIDELFNLIGYKPKNHTKEMNEDFFNALYTYLDVEDIEYANIWEKHNKIVKERIYQSLWACDTKMKESVFKVLNENDVKKIKELQLKLIDVDEDPNNIDLDDIIDIDGVIWTKTQHWIWNYVDRFCNVENNPWELSYLMQDKMSWNVYEIGEKIIVWAEEWGLIKWVWVNDGKSLQIWMFNKEWKLTWLWVNIQIDWTKEKWTYKNWELEWENCVRILWNKNKEEWSFVWWLLKTWYRYENKLSNWYEIEKQWRFAQWKYLMEWKIRYQGHKGGIASEEWKFSWWNLNWENCIRIYENWKKEEWIYENWKLINWMKTETNQEWKEIQEEWTFVDWVLRNGTRTIIEDWKTIIEKWIFNEYWELHWRDCIRTNDGVEEKWCYGNWELIDAVVFEAMEEAQRIVSEDNPRYRRGANWTENKYDCSHFVYSSYKKSIPDLEYSATANMLTGYQKFWFTCYKLSDVNDLKYWDILRKKWHTEIYCGHNQIVWAHSSRSGVSLIDTADTKLGDYTYYLRYQSK